MINWVLYLKVSVMDTFVCAGSYKGSLPLKRRTGRTASREEPLPCSIKGRRMEINLT